MNLAAKNQLTEAIDNGLVRLKGCRLGLMVYLPHDQYIGRSLDLYGEFSSGEAAFFSQVLKPGMVAVDLGANIGAHSVLFAKKVGPQGLVVSFEPQRVIYQLLCSNLTINGLFQAKLFNAAAGSSAGTIRIPPLDYSKSANFGSLSLGNWQQGDEVPVLTIDSLNLPACNLIKVDVEGMEADALSGAQQTIAKHHPILYVENDRKENSRSLLSLISSFGYRMYWHITPYFTPQNYFANSDNVFGKTVSINIIGIHRDSPVVMHGATEVASVDQTAAEVLQSN